MSRWLFGGLLIVLIYLKWPEARVTLEAGIMAPALPQQTTINDPVAFAVEHYVITPLAEFEITAKVLSRERYRFDKEADLSPIDFALASRPVTYPPSRNRGQRGQYAPDPRRRLHSRTITCR